VKLAAGLVAPSPFACAVEGTALVQFQLSPDATGDADLLDSTFASPGRYVGEILRRLRAAYPTAERYLAINPYLEVAPALAQRLVAAAADWRPGDGAGFCVLRSGGRPIGYVLSAATVDLCPAVHCGLLSCTDAALDKRLLSASFGAGGSVWAGGLEGARCTRAANGFTPLSPVLAEATRRAAELLESLPPQERLAAVQQGERSAVIGFHAGDMVFWSQALALETTCFRSAVVLSAYADILSFLSPELVCLGVDHPVPHRAGYQVVDGHAALFELVRQLEARGTAPRFWHLFRPFRDYSRPHHHLREAMAFAIGGSGHRLRRPLPSAPALRERQLSRPRPGRVIVHFEGGWSLKEYPTDRRAELLTLLRAAGYDPLILGQPEPAAPEVVAQPYTSLAAFRTLLTSAEAVIGCDSFPSHFSQALGVPTLQLFGSTRPANSRGIESPGYRYLQHPLPCVPCNAMTACPLDGSSSCRAHASAHEVLESLRRLLPLPREAPAQLTRERTLVS